MERALREETPYIGDCVELDGVRIPLDRRILTPPILEAIRKGWYEQEEAAEIPRLVQPGDRVLEIGGGIGFISTLIARRGPSRLITVEANPHLVDFIRATHAANGVRGVDVVNAVLTNEPHPVATFHLRRDFWMSSLSSGPNPFEQAIDVPTQNLDDLLRRERIDLIVCDVEGAEATLFEGADLSRVDRVYLELHDHLTGLAGIRDFFAEMGRQGFAYDPRHSRQAVVLMRKVRRNEVLRSYAG